MSEHSEPSFRTALASSRWCSRALPAWLLVITVSVWLALTGLGERDLLRKAEIRCAETAGEMLASGDWIVPQFGGEPRLEKPPLGYWLIAAASLPLGRVTEFTAVFPSAIAYIVTVLLVMAWGTSLGGLCAGLLAALAFATMPIALEKGHEAEIEMPLCLFVTFAMWMFARRWEGRTRSRAELAAGATSLALAFATKGPPALLFPLATFGALALAARRWAELRSAAPVRVLPAAGLAALALTPWVLAVCLREPDAARTWWQEVFARRLGGEPAHAEPLHFYLLRFLPAVLPGALFAPLAARTLNRPELRRSTLFLIVWVAASFALFSLIRGKRAYYLLPISPAIALLAGQGLFLWVSRVHAQRDRWVRHALAVVAGLTLLAALLVPAAASFLLGLGVRGAAVAGLSAAVLASAALAKTLRDVRAEGTVLGLLAFALAAGTFHQLYWPFETHRDSARPLGDLVERVVPPGEELHLWRTQREDLLFYVHRRQDEIEDENDLRRHARQGPLWVVIEPERLRDLRLTESAVVEDDRDPRPPGERNYLLVHVTGWRGRVAPQ